MVMRVLIAIAAVLGAASCRPAPSTPKLDVQSETAIVEQDVRVMNDAFFSGDGDTLVQHTLPAVVQKWGGPEQYAKIYMGVAAAQTKAGIKRESLTFPTPPEFIAGKNGRWFVLVPNKVVVSDGTRRGARTGLQLGVKEQGATEWKYIPGQFVRPDLLATLAPDFPADHPLPPRSTEKLPALDTSSKPE